MQNGVFVMFTGIVQAMGVVRSIQRGSTGTRLALDAPDLTRPIPAGASICVSGACLTVTHCGEISIEFDVVAETLSRSTLGSWSPGRRVNLERSLGAGDFLDGHLVHGHVDGTARVADIRRGREGHVVTFVADEELMPFVIPKGAIALDGVSLTIAEVNRDTFNVALIPTTLAATTLGSLRGGDWVNVETDIVARTIVTTMQRWRETTGGREITVEMLREQGFM
jgi:riboflavin synthase